MAKPLIQKHEYNEEKHMDFGCLYKNIPDMVILLSMEPWAAAKKTFS